MEESKNKDKEIVIKLKLLNKKEKSEKGKLNKFNKKRKSVH
jgi:hypothetical protein